MRRKTLKKFFINQFLLRLNETINKVQSVFQNILNVYRYISRLFSLSLNFDEKSNYKKKYNSNALATLSSLSKNIAIIKSDDKILQISRFTRALFLLTQIDLNITNFDNINCRSLRRESENKTRAISILFYIL